MLFSIGDEDQELVNFIVIQVDRGERRVLPGERVVLEQGVDILAVERFRPGGPPGPCPSSRNSAVPSDFNIQSGKRSANCWVEPVASFTAVEWT